MQKLKHLIIATIDGISDRIKSTISSTPIKEEVCILYNKKTKQNFVITEEKNIDTLKVYFPVIGLEKFNEKKEPKFGTLTIMCIQED